MATTFKITPTLSGSSSQKFNESLNANKSNKIPSEKKEKMKDLVSEILSKNNI